MNVPATLSDRVSATASAKPVLDPGAVDLLVQEIRHRDLGVLQDRIAAFKRIPRTEAGFPGVRAQDCRAVTNLLQTYLVAHRRGFATADPVLSARFIGLVEEMAASDIRAYPNEALYLTLTHIDALLAAGREDEALPLVAPLAERPQLIEGDYTALARIYELDTLVRLALGQIDLLQRVAFGRFVMLARWKQFRVPQLFETLYASLAIAPLFGASYGLAEFLVRLCARVRLMAERPSGRRFDNRIWAAVLARAATLAACIVVYALGFRRRLMRVQIGDVPRPEPATPNLFERLRRRPWRNLSWRGLRGVARREMRRIGGNIPHDVLPGGAPATARVGGQAVPTRQDVLVTRAMGGLGDLAMMTPGLHALARKTGRPVWFATKRQFFPLFAANPDIHLLDIDGPIDLSCFRRWINLSICPATAYETRVFPRIRKGRVEIFARAMGIGRLRLRRHGWAPRVPLSAVQQTVRDTFRTEQATAGLPLVAVQPYSRDSYKNCDSLIPALLDIASAARVIVFHTSPMPIPAHPNIVQCHGRPLDETIARLAACDYLIAVDSAFYHVAAAFGIPSLGIFGPTSGKTFSRHHPRHLLAALPAPFACSPCWRNEDKPCPLTGAQRSACLASVGESDIVLQFRALRAQYPRRSGLDTPASLPATMPVTLVQLSPPAPRQFDALPLDKVVDALRHTEIGSISEQILAFKRAPRTAAGFTGMRPADCRDITRALAAYLDANRRAFVSGDRIALGRFIDLVELFRQSDIRSYPNEVMHLDLVYASALIAAGREMEALAVTGPLAERPYLIEEDFSTLQRLFELDTFARLSLGRYEEVERVAFPRLLVLARLRPLHLPLLFGAMVSPLAVARVGRPYYGPGENAVHLLARVYLARRIGARRTVWRRLLVEAFAGLAVPAACAFAVLSWYHRRATELVIDADAPPGRPWYGRLRGWRPMGTSGISAHAGSAAPTRRDILVTRAMGGLGDIMMMTPGLHALARKRGRPVFFATKRQFFPVLANNPDIRLLDVDSHIDVSRFRRWHNFSFCPAGIYESRVHPRVRKSRAEVFAGALGIGVWRLWLHGWTPRLHLSAAQQTARDALRVELGAGARGAGARGAGLPIIGVQPFSREMYRGYRHMADVILALADHAKVLVFHTSPMQLPAHPNVIQMHGSPLTETIGLLAASDYFLSVDSAFFHFAAALQIPTLGIFGPTSGRVRSAHYRRVRLMQTPIDFPCAPCWRNEDIPCYVTAGSQSACLASMPASGVVAEMQRLMADFAPARIA